MVIPGKSYAEVLKTDSQSQCMHSHVKNGVATQQRHPPGKLAGWGYLAPTKNLNISSDSPAYKSTTKVKANVTPNQFHRPVPVFNRFSPLHEVVDLKESSVNDTLDDIDYKFSDHEGDLGILELSTENSVNIANHDDFDKLLLKKRVDQKLIQQARSSSEYMACKQQMGNVFGVIPLSPLKLYQGPKTNNASTSDILTLHRAVKSSNCPNYMAILIPVASKLKIWPTIEIDNW